VGSEGELWIGGVGVARGYLNAPELTKEVNSTYLSACLCVESGVYALVISVLPHTTRSRCSTVATPAALQMTLTITHIRINDIIFCTEILS
jgi:acyl-CoA synthetase (AMP-forming)/AMP-acid ligase II